MVSRIQKFLLRKTQESIRDRIGWWKRDYHPSVVPPMRIQFLDRKGKWSGKLLCITHSDRPTELERCALNFLEMRYGDPNRLPPSVAFDTLSHSSTHQPHLGAVTIWQFEKGDYSKPRLLASLRPEGYKPQHAIWYRERLWILGTHQLEVYDSTLLRCAVIEDPWLSGAHTIVPDGRGKLLITCSASDSVLIIDEASLVVERALRMPEAIYGRNFDLSRTDSVVEHYVPNDLQLTHINSASSWRGGVVVSTLIGAIGWFDLRGEYRELLRGFVGCHAIRPHAQTGHLYFSDSCLGVVVFLDGELRISRRVDTQSRWLHDALQLEGEVFATSIVDRNQVIILNLSSREPLIEIPGAEFGMGTQFLSYGA